MCENLNIDGVAVLPRDQKIDRFLLVHSGASPLQYWADAERTGDAGIYEELRVGIFDANDDCVGDVLVGITEEGCPRVLLTVGNNGNDGQQIAVYPTKPAEEAIDTKWA